jgi:hypothetical protein
MGQYIHNTASPSTHKLRVHKLRVNVYDHTTHIVYTSWQSGKHVTTTALCNTKQNYTSSTLAGKYNSST